jgi:hypothetical protein
VQATTHAVLTPGEAVRADPRIQQLVRNDPLHRMPGLTLTSCLRVCVCVCVHGGVGGFAAVEQGLCDELDLLAKVLQSQGVAVEPNGVDPKRPPAAHFAVEWTMVEPELTRVPAVRGRAADRVMNADNWRNSVFANSAATAAAAAATAAAAAAAAASSSAAASGSVGHAGVENPDSAVNGDDAGEATGPLPPPGIAPQQPA